MAKLEKLNKIRKMEGFRSFLREQGVMNLAIAFILGGAISKFVTSLVTDIINPLLNAGLGGIDDLDKKVAHIGKISVHYGSFIANGIDFLVIALVIYIGVKLLNIDREQIGKIDIGKMGTLNSLSKK